MIHPTLEQAKALAKGHSVIPIAMEMFSDLKTPIEVLRTIRRKNPRCFILESVNGSDHWGRYSFLGYHPSMTLSGKAGNITMQKGGIKTTQQGSASDAIRAVLADFKSPRIASLPPFTGGFVGYFAYSFVASCVPGLTLQAQEDPDALDFHVMLMDKVIAFDQYRQKITLIVNVRTDDLENGYVQGITTLKDMERMILSACAPEDETPAACGEFESAFSQSAFEDTVRAIQHHIHEGDIFQAVLSNRFTAPFQGSLLDTYRLLRTTNPSPYMVYMRMDDMEIACASPETLISLRAGEVSSFPLAGTCPRSDDAAQDATLTDALLADEKELSEHDMLVDLARNDIGKVCEFGSVRVAAYRQIKRFAHVSHIASHVTGRLQKDRDALDVLMAAFPAGTLSGAPKKRACQIIDALEPQGRGLYGGAIGYIDFAGNMDMCIGIRMAVLSGGQVRVQAGAGIVEGSVPSREYTEIQNKARAVMDALRMAKGE